jgi:hypothetical protein
LTDDVIPIVPPPASGPVWDDWQLTFSRCHADFRRFEAFVLEIAGLLTGI